MWMPLCMLLGLALGPLAGDGSAAQTASNPPASAPTEETSMAAHPTTFPAGLERRMELLKPAEFRRLRDQAPIAYLAWGSHEWHGPHLPLGTDTVKAHWLCRALADKTGGVVFPAVYCGFGVMTNPGKDTSLGFPKELVQQTAHNFFVKLQEQGFRVVVVVMGHYGRAHVQAMQETARAVEEELQGRLTIIAEPDYAWTSPEFPGDHAAANETSYMLLFEPPTVDVSRLPSSAQAKDLLSQGVHGRDPRTEASAQRGRKQLELLLARAVPQIQAALAKAATTQPATDGE